MTVQPAVRGAAAMPARYLMAAKESAHAGCLMLVALPAIDSVLGGMTYLRSTGRSGRS